MGLKKNMPIVLKKWHFTHEILQNHQGLHCSNKNATVKPVLSGHSKRRPKLGFQERLSLTAGQKYCRKLQGEHSAILLTCIKLPFDIKIFVLSIFEWSLKTGFTVFGKIYIETLCYLVVYFVIY